MIDIQDYLHSEFEADLKDAILLPQGEEFVGMVKSESDIKLRKVNRKDGSIAYVAELTFHFEGPEVLEKTGREETTARWTAWLDFTSHGLDQSPGANKRLFKLRKALGQDNQKTWAFYKAVGAPVTCRIAHDVREDAGDTYQVVSQVREA